jgi:hypothetical protein
MAIDGGANKHSANPTVSETESLPEATEVKFPGADADGAENEAFALVAQGTDSAISAVTDQLADNDALAAVVSTTPDVLEGIHHTLDQLATATDLFDVPPMDFDGTSGS